jgi:hypothetical protein
MYNDAEEMIGNFLSVTQSQSPAVIGARWGRLACRILGISFISKLLSKMFPAKPSSSMSFLYGFK